MDSKLYLIAALAIALTTVSFGNESSSVASFEAFKAKHSKVYASEAEE